MKTSLGLRVRAAPMRKRYTVAVIVAAFAAAAAIALAAPVGFKNVRPNSFDPQATQLVSAQWIDGIGCPTDVGSTHYSDGVCLTGDPKDVKHQEGLLLNDSVENPPVTPVPPVFAAADLTGVSGIELTELGWDIRGPGLGFGTYPPGPAASNSNCSTNPLTSAPTGSPACFKITLQDDSIYNFGCVTIGVVYSGYWTRFRCTAPIKAFNATTGAIEVISGRPVKSIQIEMRDTITGVVILDNINVNGTLVGQGK